MNSVEKIAKTVDDAISLALISLNASMDDVDVTIIDEGSKGILGIGSKPAKVLVTKKPAPIDIAQQFLREVTLTMGLNIQIDVNLKEKHLFINMKGENIGVLIGKRGQTLDSLQYLTNLVVNRNSAPEFSVILDTENYRKRRKDTLESLASSIAKKVKATKKSVVLEPMSRYERHIIHTALQNDRNVKTYSEGNEPYRNVVITPK